MTMRLACVVAISGYSPTDLASKRESLKAILRPDTQLDMFAARSGVPYIESSVEFYLSEGCRGPEVWRSHNSDIMPSPGRLF